MSFRKLLFWAHLTAGLVSGLSIGVMCFTGVALAFEKELIAWAERDARQVAPPVAGAPRLTLDELQRKLRETEAGARPASIVVQNDPHAAVLFSTGRSGGFHVNPYTGEVRQPKSAAMSRFMQVMVEWHRYLGLGGEASRPRGKLINGICNVAFCVLALTGLYLWMPRAWTWRALRPVVWFRQNDSGKARDFNWHNTIGFWSAPVLIVLTLTAMPISFRWAGNLIFTLTGTPLPAAGAGGPAGGGAPANTPAVEIPSSPPGTRTLPLNALVAAAQKQLPEWQTITVRIGSGGRGGAGAGAGAGGRTEAQASSSNPSGGEDRSTPQPVALTVRERASWPRTATTTLMLNPYTGEILRRSGYADLTAAQQVRSWTRFLHTGEAVGKWGQFVAGLACAGGLFLVYTGFALSWRRFFGRQNLGEAAPDAPSREVDVQPAAAGRSL